MKRRSRWLIALVTLVVIAGAVLVLHHPSESLSPVVAAPAGPVRGVIRKDAIVYRGVPFAQPPVGDLRWRAPEPATPWTGVLEATAFKPACMQMASGIPGEPLGPTSEDCLYLNIWTPRVSSTTKLPVMVYLYGGGGVRGSASTRFYWGDALVRHGVITVNVSYRVGMLGWLAHPELSQEASYHASGNYAFLDMIAGLRWVRDNIAAFGGDPNNVTVFGQSAGAFNESRLMASPLAAGLFHKVIGESGGDFYPAGSPGGNTLLADAERAGIEFAASLGAASIAELRRMPADKITAAPLPEPLGRLPIIDGYATTADTQTLYNEGKQQKLPLLIGFNAQEGANLELPPPANAAAFTQLMKVRYGGFAPRILQVYPAGNDEEARQSFIRWHGESSINWNVATWARLHSSTGEAPVYVYHFAQSPPFGPLKKLGAAHGAELPYVFGFIPTWMRRMAGWPWKTSQDVQLAMDIPRYWTNFAKTGNPNAPGLATWPDYRLHQQVLEFADGIRTISLPGSEEHAVMDAYFEQLTIATP